MKDETFFAEQWPTMRARLSRALASSGVPAADREDVLQETALRLYQHWDRILPDRPVDAYARVIALNVWRSLCRQRANREILSAAMPDRPDLEADTERTSLARLELGRLGQLLGELRPEQRDVLLDGLGADRADGDSTEPVPARLRMARMRVRRQLAACLRYTAAVGAAIVLPFRYLFRQGWTSPTSAIVGGTMVVAVAIVISSDSVEIRPRPTPLAEPPAMTINAPERVTHGESGVERQHVAYGTRSRETDSIGSTRDVRADSPVLIDPGRPPIEIDPPKPKTLWGFDTSIGGHRTGGRVYDRGPDQIPACVVGVEAASVAGLSC